MYRRIILSNSPVFEFSIFSWYNFNFVVRYSNSQKNVHKMKIKNAFLRWFLKLFQYALKISTKNATMLLSLPEFLNSLLFSFSLSLKIYFFLNRISRGSGRFSMHLNFFLKTSQYLKMIKKQGNSLSHFASVTTTPVGLNVRAAYRDEHTAEILPEPYVREALIHEMD